MSKPSIVFFGTGQTSLEALVALSRDFAIELIVTKPMSRNETGKIQKTPLQLWAEEHGRRVITPKNKAELAATMKSIPESKVGVVLDYGIIIPAEVIDSFELGIINSHFSLLPRWRGADPIRAAILAGDATTGVSIMKITPGLDDGPILAHKEFAMPEGVTEPVLRTRLSAINTLLLPAILAQYTAGTLTLAPQDNTKITHSRKVSKEDGKLNAKKSAAQLERELRAYTAWPKSYVFVQEMQIIIKNAVVSDIEAPLGVFSTQNKKLYFGCKGGSLEVLELQPAGKAAMNSQAFINGYRQFLE